MGVTALVSLKDQNLLQHKVKIWNMSVSVCYQLLSVFGPNHFFSRSILIEDSLEKPVMLGIVSGTRRRGRPRTRWLDTIKTDTKMNIQQLKEAVLDREEWRALVQKSPRVGHGSMVKVSQPS